LRAEGEEKPMAGKPQTFANHARFDPPYHFFLMPVMMLTVIITIVHLFRFPSLESGWLLVLSIAGVLAVIKFRFYALRVQDRVIRLEERLRLMSVLPEPLRSRIGELSEPQLIGLRFAPDAELPGLVNRALTEKLGRQDIKKAVVNWRPDYWRV